MARARGPRPVRPKPTKPIPIRSTVRCVCDELLAAPLLDGSAARWVTTLVSAGEDVKVAVQIRHLHRHPVLGLHTGHRPMGGEAAITTHRPRMHAGPETLSWWRRIGRQHACGTLTLAIARTNQPHGKRDTGPTDLPTRRVVLAGELMVVLTVASARSPPQTKQHSRPTLQGHVLVF